MSKPRLTSMTVAEFKKDPCADAFLKKMSGSVLKATDDPSKPIRYRISNQREDRDEDTVAAAGWKLEDYNGVILFGHDGRQPAIGKSPVWIEGDSLMADASFVSRDLYPFGGMVGDMVRAGFMPSASVGFKPSKWEIAADRLDPDDNGWSQPLNFLEQELLEWSVVTVPSNPDAGVAGGIALDAMIGRAKHAGIDVSPALAWAEELLERAKGEGSWISRKDLEAVAKLLGRSVVIDLGKSRDAKSLNGESVGAGGALTPEASTMDSKKPGSGKKDDGGDSVTMAAHLEALNLVKDSFASMHAEHKSAMADLHSKMQATQDSAERTHKALTAVCAKMAAIVGTDANGDLKDPPAAPAPSDDSSSSGKARVVSIAKGAHALSGAQYKRFKGIRTMANEALAAHHASDGNEEAPAEGDAGKDAKGTALVPAPAPPAPAASEADVRTIDEIFSRGGAAIAQRLDAKLEASKRELVGKPN